MKSVASRFGWPFVDQGISTATNFAMLAVIARNSSAEDFGAFVVAYASYGFVLALTQGLVGEPFLVTLRERSSGNGSDSSRASEALGAGLLAGGVASVVMLGIQAFLWGPTISAFSVMALATPLLVVQDLARYVMLGTGRARSAASNDASWALMQSLAFAAVLSFGVLDASPVVFASIWAGSGAACGLLACGQLGCLPSVPHGGRWLKRHRSLSASYAVEASAFAASTQLTTLVVASFVTLDAAGGLRAAQAIYGPIGVMLVMLRMIGIREATRAVEINDGPSFARTTSRLSLLGFATTSTLVVALLAMPSSVGVFLFGATWATAKTLIFADGLQKVVIGYSTGVFAALRSLQAVRIGLITRLITAIATTVGGFGGALLDGALGCAYGLAIGTALGVIAMRLGLYRHVRRARTSGLDPRETLEHSL